MLSRLTGTRKLMLPKFRLMCTAKSDRADIKKFNQYVAVIVDKERVPTEGLMVPGESKAHGTGMFAIQNIPRGTVLCVTGPGGKEQKDEDYCDESELINDLHYTYARRNIGLNKAVADYTYEDYQMLIEEYCNIETVPQYSNVVVTAFNQKYFVEAHRDIQEGEELSRLYTVQFWLNHHLTELMAANDKSIYSADHPLIKTMLELSDPYSLRCFAAVLNFHATDEENKGNGQ